MFYRTDIITQSAGRVEMIFADGFRQQLFYICGLPDGFKAVKIYGLHCLHGLLPAWIALSLVL
jgi:hypothetical protein